MKAYIFLFFFGSVLLFINCRQPEKEYQKTERVKNKMPVKEMQYHFEKGKQWTHLYSRDSVLQKIVTELNRTDFAHLQQMDSILMPKDTTASLFYYFPFPFSVAAIKDIDKIIFFSYPTQSFAAYENGEIVYTGATNMGRQKDRTPTGLFFTNWKAEKTTSTFNDEWDLHWNFNLENKLGVGWHQYTLPGYPASHSCLRLQESDARYLYNWAAQWVVDKKDSVIAQGTPVVIFGTYDFSASKPWLQLVQNSHALDISASEMDKLITPFLQKIKAEQERRMKQ